MHYLYQYYSRGYRKMKSEEETIAYFSRRYKPKYKENLGPISIQKLAHKLLKTVKCGEDWAKFAWENGLQFHVCRMLGQELHAYMIQDVTKDLVVCFVDENGRKFMHYVFQPQPNGQYFMAGILFFEFEPDSTENNDDLKMWTYTFEPDGTTMIYEHDKVNNTKTTWKSKEPLNVAKNWEPRPAFDNWEGLFKMKRWEIGELHEPFRGLPNDRRWPWEKG